MRDHFPARLAIVHMLPAVAATRGLDHRRVFAAAGLDADRPGWETQVVARARISAVLDMLARNAGDATIGLDLAAAVDPGALGPTGRALAAGRTLGEALDAHIRQMPDLQGGLDYRLEREGPVVRLVHRYHGGHAEDTRVMSEGVAAFIAMAIRAMAGPEVELQVTLPHRARAPLRLYEDRLAVAVRFAPGDRIAVAFDATLLDRPNRLATVADVPQAVVGIHTDDTTLDDAGLARALDRLLAPAALAGRLTLPHAAAMLGLAPRSLQRRLSAMGTSFEETADAWRRRTACDMLRGTTMQVREVALMLGYADSAHFVRAFRRWEGTTPTAWRTARIG